MTEKLKMCTPDLTQANIEKIAELFPNVITEIEGEDGKPKKGVDFDLLKQALSDVLVEDENERYRLDWPGKKKSLLKANTPINKTLRPCREESVNFDTTENLYIEGDNFEVLKILQESYLGKVKMIYIDPPYNTGNDFIYKDDYKVSKEEYEEELGSFDEDGGRLFKNTDSNGRFHSDWLSMMYERLVIARDLLKDDGVIFISIDDNEVHNLRKLCDEIFGEDNLLAVLPRITKRSGKSTDLIAKNNDYLLVYSKSELLKLNEFAHDDDGFKFEDEYLSERGKYKLNQTLDYDTLGYVNSLDYKITIDGKDYFPGGVDEKMFNERKKNNPKDGFRWRWSKEMFDFGLSTGFVVVKHYEDKLSRIYTKTYQNATITKQSKGQYSVEFKKRTKSITSLDFLENQYSNDNARKDLAELFDEKIFDYSKPVSLINKLVLLTTKNDDIVLDFFSGSATSAHAVYKANSIDKMSRKMLSVQLPEAIDIRSDAYKIGLKTITEIGKERIRRAGKKILEELEQKNQQLKLGEVAEDASKLDIGFRVYKLDESNMKEVYYHPNQVNQDQLSLSISNIKDGRTAEDLLTQVILDLGLELNLPIEVKNLQGNNVFFVQGNSLVACFDDSIDFGIVDEIAKAKPLRVVFKDAGFRDDKDRINLEERFKRLSPETQIRVI